jgi:MFS family permease
LFCEVSIDKENSIKKKARLTPMAEKSTKQSKFSKSLVCQRLWGLDEPARPAEEGIRRNIVQFLLLCAITCFLGGVYGVERVIMPGMARDEFGQTSLLGGMSFIIAYGIGKAFANLLVGKIANHARVGRKKMLVLGWILVIPVPAVVIYTDSWAAVSVTTVLLGIMQGFAWSATIYMMVDMVEHKYRGLAIGINELAGWGSVAIIAGVSGYMRDTYNARPEPWILQAVLIFLGLIFSLFARETLHFVKAEAVQAGLSSPEEGEQTANKYPHKPTFWEAVRLSTVGDRRLFANSFAACMEQFKDGIAWGMLPVFFSDSGMDSSQVSILSSIYPAIWAVTMPVAGWLGDRYGYRLWIIAGFGLQALAFAFILVPAVNPDDTGDPFGWFATGQIVLGIGTGLSYPLFHMLVANVTSPNWRTPCMGVMRFYRDIGYVLGAVIGGFTVDAAGYTYGIALGIGVCVATSGIFAYLGRRMPTQTPLPEHEADGNADALAATDAERSCMGRFFFPSNHACNWR